MTSAHVGFGIDHETQSAVIGGEIGAEELAVVGDHEMLANALAERRKRPAVEARILAEIFARLQRLGETHHALAHHRLRQPVGVHLKGVIGDRPVRVHARAAVDP